MLWNPEAALGLATFAHSGQVDKAGVPYIRHPIAVAHIATLSYSLGNSTYGKDYVAVPEALRDNPPLDHMRDLIEMVALLHDVVEDTYVTLEDFERWHAPEPLIRAVHRLTLRRTTRAAYYQAVKSDPVALLVKRADVFHNAGRIGALKDAADRDRLTKKYDAAMEALA